jgi:competence protein ComEC
MRHRKNIFIKIAAGSLILAFLTVPVLLRLRQLDARENAVKDALNGFVSDKTQVSVIGIIDAEPDIKPSAQDFTIHVERVNDVQIDTRILVSSKLYPRYSYGDRVSLIGKLIVPRNFSDGGGGAGDDGNPDADGQDISDNRVFDYIHYLSKDGIFFTMKNPAVDVIGTGAGNPVYAKLFELKESFLRNIRQILTEPQASLAAGEIVGDKASLGNALTDDFRRSGLIHIVILSGYSIAIIADSIQRVLSVVPYLPRWASLFSGAAGILLFGIMIGGKATAVRACIMSIMSIAAKIMYRDYHALRALILTAYIMILQNPYIVAYDSSFQVSFTATLGLILLGKHIEHFLKKFPRLFPERFEIRALITSTLATQIAVAPLILYMMGDASVVGLFANLIVVPFIPLTLLVIFCTGMFGYMSGLPGIFSMFGLYAATAAGAVAQFFLSYELLIVRFFGTFPYAIVTINNFSIWMMWLTYAGYAAVYIILKRRTQRKSSSRSPPS